MLRCWHIVVYAGCTRRCTVAHAAAVNAPKVPSEGPIILDGQVLHSITPQRLEIINSMEQDGWVGR
jgi:hypothetical protein